MLTRILRIVGSAAAIMVLSSCVPLYDVSVLNDTGSDITVIMPVGRPEQIHIPRGAAVPVDLLVARAGQPEQFVVVCGSHRWRYSRYMDTFGVTHFASIAASVLSEFTLASTRADASTCCHRQIHLFHNLQDFHSIPSDTNASNQAMERTADRCTLHFLR
jgi:hypothetical protein